MMKLKGFLKGLAGTLGTAGTRKSAKEGDPETLDLVVTGIRSASRASRTVRFERAGGGRLPAFTAGQYISIAFTVDGKVICRPYSISSAPYEAQAENGYVEITVEKPDRDGFIANYICDTLAVGDRVKAAMPLGHFYWDPERDAEHVVALAGGIGVTPFASMAKEIAHGTLDFDLTILYGSGSSDDIILKDELEALSCDKVHIVHVISGEDPSWHGERGLFTADLIQKYSAPDTTYFICGPQAMYLFLREEFPKTGAPEHRVRFEMFGPVRNIAACPGYPAEKKDEVYHLTVKRGGHARVIPARASESLVVAMERAGVTILTDCRSGECGFCRTKVLRGEYFVSPEGDGRSPEERKRNCVHACATFPLSDMTVRIPELEEGTEA